ncbi:phage major capsid protein [Devosia rhodophyticola]|uniref:Phage major capsid protein n=1 Tax=Devosia rhodophyticola TaxID=3026423 RepID=A0ABY7YX75_9HYPH|nr:phage major capsid protein [Devosia rhodophyticola]WDR05620.1 phage major capsid protein [Devosia rhodophyticola]
MTSKLELKADIAVDDAGTITGVAWPFGEPDSVGDVIEKGAFSFPAALPIVLEHDQGAVIGVWESYSETDAGLEVKGRLFVEGVAPSKKAHAELRKGRMAGLSLGFKGNAFTDRTGGGRTFTDIDVTEISLCRNPVHPGARITAVKATPPKENLMDPETIDETETKAALELKAANDNLTKLTARLEKLEAKAQRPVAANDNEPTATEERKAFAQYLRLGNTAGDTVLKALNVSNDAQGGYLAPAEVSSEFIRELVEFSPLRTVATVRNTGAPSVILPKRTGQTNAKWKGELQATTESEIGFGQLEIPTKELGTHVDISAQLLDDAPVAEAEVRLALAEDFGQKEGVAFLNGDGVLAPRGLMTDDAITHTANGHATNLAADQLITLMYALPATYRNRGTWLLNGTTLATIRKLKDGQGNYLWQPSYQAGQPETILGRPVVEMVDMPDVEANAFPIIFGDFGTAYRIYDRLEMSVFANPYLLATEGLVRIHARRRTGGDVVQPKAVRKLKMATA